MANEDEVNALRVEAAVLEEAREIAALLKLPDPVRVITGRGQCRVHLPKNGEAAKRCSTCRQEFTLDSFNKNRANADRLQCHCRQCDYTTLRLRRNDTSAKLKRAAKKAANDAVREVKEELRGTKGKVTRKLWPALPDERRKALIKTLPQALMDYDGQESQMSVALCISVEEIREAISSSKSLQRIHELAKTVAISKVEANAYKMAMESNNAAIIKFWLTNNSPNWSEKSSVEMRNVGFGAPEDDAAPAPILKIVNHKPED